MKLTHVKGNTYVLEGWGMIPLYKLDDTHCILLDCGLTEERGKIEETLAENNLTLVGIIVSHAHGDHSGNCRYFQQMYHIPIAMPMGEAGLCYSLLTLKSYFYMSSPNSILSVSDMVLDVDCPISRRDGPFYFQGANFQIIHTPGHSPDHVAIVTPDDVCYAGDAVLTNPPFPSGRPLRFPFAVAVQPTLDSLEKLMNTYLELSAQKIKGENITKTLRGIEEILDTIEPAFNRQLDNLYEDQAIDISSDITVLEGMLDHEGLGRTTTEL